MLTHKIVAITGASSGIGAEMAILLSEHGAIPVLMARSLEKLQAIGSQIQGRYSLIVLDVTDEGQVQRGIAQVLGEYGKIDILINNAGYGVFSSFADTPLAHFEEMMDVNFMGTVRCTQAVLPSMLAAGQGHIINIASIAGKMGTAKSTSYSASKHAVLGFTNSLRQELAGTGVMISAVNPGPIDTPFFEIADPSGHYVRNIRWFMLQPRKVAIAVLKMIVHKKVEINLPLTAGIGIKLYQLFPRIFEKLTYKMMNRK
ncbi:MAG TPA: SDR family oxidoreductase [Bacilli bacterium]